MAGLGSRARSEDMVPKALKLTNGKPLFAWAIDGLPIDIASDITLVVSAEVANHPTFNHLLHAHVPKGIPLNVCVLDKTTSGQAETVVLGSREVPQENGILIFNCDTHISDDFPRDYQEWDGILGTFPSTNPSMSYVEVNSRKVLRTAEKIVISPLASTGLYYFKSKELFLEAYEHTSHQIESFVAPLYNYLIETSRSVTFFETRNFAPLGTIEEINGFEPKKCRDNQR